MELVLFLLPMLIFVGQFVLPGSLGVRLSAILRLLARATNFLVEIVGCKWLDDSGIDHLFNSVSAESLRVLVVKSTNSLATLLTTAVTLHLQLHSEQN